MTHGSRAREVVRVRLQQSTIVYEERLGTFFFLSVRNVLEKSDKIGYRQFYNRHRMVMWYTRDCIHLLVTTHRPLYTALCVYIVRAHRGFFAF